MIFSGHRVYISGPMTGIPDCNRKSFFAAETMLIARGAASVFNPARQPDGLTWAEYLRRDIRGLKTCSMIALLPGWHLSKGAKIEKNLAARLGLRFYVFPEHGDFVPVVFPNQHSVPLSF